MQGQNAHRDRIGFALDGGDGFIRMASHFTQVQFWLELGCRNALTCLAVGIWKNKVMRSVTAAIFLLNALSTFAQTHPPIFTGQLGVAADSFQNGKFKEAHEALDQYEKSNPPNGSALDLRGCVYMEQGNFAAAAKAFEAAHAADPSLFAPRLHSGDLAIRQKEYTKARDIYEALLKDTNIMISNERVRFAILMAYLGARDESGARAAVGKITFPTQSPTYYYAQAAWAFAHGKNSDARRWLKTAAQMYESDSTAWFERFLYELGWIKKKPPIAFYHS